MSRQHHLIGAYGMFWQLEEVSWFPGNGRNWQLLGKVGTNVNKLRVCDFRKARGFYILFDDYGASYVGLARGRQGLGQRLRTHVKDQSKSWSRFCWFAFDNVRATRHQGWWEVVHRDAVGQANATTVVRELEALLIKVLGSRNQNQMKFLNATKWDQVTWADCQRGQPLTKVDPEPLVDWSLRTALRELD